jgi:hypothetical protein
MSIPQDLFTIGPDTKFNMAILTQIDITLHKRRTRLACQILSPVPQKEKSAVSPVPLQSLTAWHVLTLTSI